MMKNNFVTVYLYGRLRKLATHQTPQGEHLICLPCQEGDRIKDIISQLNLEADELSHFFLNGEYSGLTCRVMPGDRLGIFGRDMHLLYRQYFPVKEDDNPVGGDN